jgi:predicted SprT family Zn-dependent metalloprotease
VVHTTNDPTAQTYATLEAAIRHFNDRLFGGRLPPCLITFQRRSNAFGYFAHDRFEHRDSNATTDEIALNPRHINERPPADTLSTLVHEMAHLQQQHFGKPGRGRYHNVEWAEMMEAVGLVPSNTGEPGGKRTGDSMSHYIVDGGPFDVACREFLAKHPGLVWGDRPVEKQTGGKRSKYVCGEDGIAAWARPGVRLYCGEHSTPMVMVEVAPKLVEDLAVL